MSCDKLYYIYKNSMHTVLDGTLFTTEFYPCIYGDVIPQKDSGAEFTVESTQCSFRSSHLKYSHRCPVIQSYFTLNLNCFEFHLV